MKGFSEGLRGNILLIFRALNIFFQVMLSTFLVPSSLYFVSNYWIYPLNDYIGDTGCYMLIYSRDIGNFIIQLHSFFMATFRYVCLFHDNLLQKFNLSPNVSTVESKFKKDCCYNRFFST